MVCMCPALALMHLGHPPTPKRTNKTNTLWPVLQCKAVMTPLKASPWVWEHAAANEAPVSWLSHYKLKLHKSGCNWYGATQTRMEYSHAVHGQHCIPVIGAIFACDWHKQDMLRSVVECPGLCFVLLHFTPAWEQQVFPGPQLIYVGTRLEVFVGYSSIVWVLIGDLVCKVYLVVLDWNVWELYASKFL